MATKCIVCGNDRKGAPVSDDIVIRSIRRVKTALRIAQNNKLVVCTGCMEEHLSRKKKFEKWLIINGGIGVAVTLVFFILSQNKITGILAGIFIMALMVGFTILSSYHPSLVEYPEESDERKRPEQPKKAKKKPRARK